MQRAQRSFLEPGRDIRQRHHTQDTRHRPGRGHSGGHAELVAARERRGQQQAFIPEHNVHVPLLRGYTQHKHAYRLHSPASHICHRMGPDRSQRGRKHELYKRGLIYKHNGRGQFGRRETQLVRVVVVRGAGNFGPARRGVMRRGDVVEFQAHGKLCARQGVKPRGCFYALRYRDKYAHPGHRAHRSHSRD